MKLVAVMLVMQVGPLELVLVLFCAVALIALFGWGAFLLLVQLGVIFKKASEPPYKDHSDYSLSQGRDVGKDE